jgi:hypothetical protein
LISLADIAADIYFRHAADYFTPMSLIISLSAIDIFDAISLPFRGSRERH